LPGGIVNLVFLDPKTGTTTCRAPFERQLGGTESALCYLLINGVAAVTVPLVPGAHQVFALYLADDRSGTGVSALVPLLVEPAPPPPDPSAPAPLRRRAGRRARKLSPVLQIIGFVVLTARRPPLTITGNTVVPSSGTKTSPKFLRGPPPYHRRE